MGVQATEENMDSCRNERCWRAAKQEISSLDCVVGTKDCLD